MTCCCNVVVSGINSQQVCISLRCAADYPRRVLVKTQRHSPRYSTNPSYPLPTTVLYFRVNFCPGILCAIANSALHQQSHGPTLNGRLRGPTHPRYLALQHSACNLGILRGLQTQLGKMQSRVMVLMLVGGRVKAVLHMVASWALGNPGLQSTRSGQVDDAFLKHLWSVIHTQLRITDAD